MIALVDYGAGNLTSVRKALSAIGAAFTTPSSPDAIDRAAGVIVPGVGHFGSTSRLDDPWRAALLGCVGRGVPLLGVCVGMQWLFEGSEEAPGVRGLGLLEGRCTRLPDCDAAGQRHKIPHVGWNSLVPASAGRLLRGVPPESQVYFTHSYAAPVTSACIAATTHSAPFAAAVERDNVFGVQFHPEKSSDAGLRILRNFLDAVEAHHRVP